MAKKAIFKTASAAILNFKNFNFWSRDCNWPGSISDVVYQISLKSDDFSQRYGDITIFKMAAVRHLGFKKIAVFVMRPLLACRSASAYKISLKSFNWPMIYGQKSDFQDGGRRNLEFQKFQFLVT